MKKVNVHFYSFENFNIPGAAANRHLAFTKYCNRKQSKSFLYSVLHHVKESSEESPIDSVSPCNNKISNLLKSLSFVLSSISSIRKRTCKDEDNIIFFLGTLGGFFVVFHLLARVYGFRIYHERTELPELMTGKTLLRKVDFWFYKLCVVRVDKLFVITKVLKDYFVKCGVSANKISILNMCVDFDRFSEPNTRFSTLSENKFVVTFCGDLTSSKDSVNILIQAVAKEISLGKNVYLKLIGDCYSKYFSDTLEPLIFELKIRDRVELVGTVPAKDVPKLLHTSDLLALSRADSEQARYGFPTKLGEYLATGVPVLITETGEIGEFLTDNISAFLVQPGDVEALSKKIHTLMNNYPHALEVANKGREVALEFFNAESVAELILQE